MDYTLTRIDPNGENDRYPLQKQEIVTDPGARSQQKRVHGQARTCHARHGQLGS